MLKYIQSSIFSNDACNEAKKANGKPGKQTKSEEAISLKSNEGDSAKLSFRKAVEPKAEAKIANGPNSLISFDEPISDLPSNDLMATAVASNDQVDGVRLARDHPFTGDHLNDLESIKEDLLIPDLLAKEDAVPSVIGIDELNDLKFENNISSDQPSDDTSHEEPSYDGNWYLKKLDGEISRIKEKIDQIETICLDEQLSNHEEIEGKIRSAIGKGNLLINQKLSQFKELCNKNLVSE